MPSITQNHLQTVSTWSTTPARMPSPSGRTAPAPSSSATRTAPWLSSSLLSLLLHQWLDSTTIALGSNSANHFIRHIKDRPVFSNPVICCKQHFWKMEKLNKTFPFQVKPNLIERWHGHKSQLTHFYDYVRKNGVNLNSRLHQAPVESSHFFEQNLMLHQSITSLLCF